MVNMPALLGRVHKIEGLVSLLNSKQSLPHWLKTVCLFSTGGRGGSIEQTVGDSDDFFPQGSDSGFDDNGSNRRKGGRDTQHRSSEPVESSRPLRGQKPNNQHSEPIESSRPLRGQKPINQTVFRSFRPKFDGNRDRPNMDRTNKSCHGDMGFKGRNNVETSRDADQGGESFLDKFRLGFDNKTGNLSEIETSNSSEKEVNTSLPQDADEIFKKMKESGLIPNAVAMLDGLCKDGNVQEALKLFGLMREKGTIPEIVIYTAVVEGYTKAHKADDAIRIFRKMQSNGISPNAFSYTVIIQGLYKCSRLQDAFEFCVEMLEAGHSPNVITFVGLVDSFCKEQGVEEAKGAIKTLTEKGFDFDEKAVRVFLDKKAPFSPFVWEAIFGKKAPQRPF